MHVPKRCYKIYLCWKYINLPFANCLLTSLALLVGSIINEHCVEKPIPLQTFYWTRLFKVYRWEQKWFFYSAWNHFHLCSWKMSKMPETDHLCCQAFIKYYLYMLICRNVLEKNVSAFSAAFTANLHSSRKILTDKFNTAGLTSSKSLSY